LYGLELFLKAIAAVGSESLLGPTLAGAGMGFLLPLTELKPVQLPEDLQRQLLAQKASVYSGRDKVLVDCVWVIFFISLGAWMYSVSLSFPSSPGHQTSNLWPTIIGCSVFAI
jgi:hypothetical protein